MEQKWVVIGDELRMGNIDSYDKLIGENGDVVKCYGTFEIDHEKKVVHFKVIPFFENSSKISWVLCLGDIKKQGFYSPMIKDYVWELGDGGIYI